MGAPRTQVGTLGDLLGKMGNATRHGIGSLSLSTTVNIDVMSVIRLTRLNIEITFFWLCRFGEVEDLPALFGFVW
jgi:hypothetical protein